MRWSTALGREGGSWVWRSNNVEIVLGGVYASQLVYVLIETGDFTLSVMEVSSTRRDLCADFSELSFVLPEAQFLNVEALKELSGAHIPTPLR